MCESGVMYGDMRRIGGLVKVDRGTARPVVDLTDQDASEAWFTSQMPNIRSQLANRAALRALPLLDAEKEENRFEALTLLALRAALVSWLKGLAVEREIAFNADFDRVVGNAAPKYIFETRMNGAYSGQPATSEATSALSQSVAAANFGKDAFFATVSAIHAFRFSDDIPGEDYRTLAEQSAIAAFNQDLEDLNMGEELGRLWPLETATQSILQQRSNFIARLSEKECWSFWHKWYLAMWNGTFGDWDLAHEIAKIDNKLWDGEDALAKVAVEIEKIRVIFDLRKQVASLKSQLAQVATEKPSALIGHNNPPEAIEDATPTQATVIIWAEITTLEKELTSETPTVEGVRDASVRWARLVKGIKKLFADIAYDHTKEAVWGTIFAASAAGSKVLWPQIVASVDMISKLIDKWLGYLILGM